MSPSRTLGTLRRIPFVLSWLVILPSSSSYAQATLAGVVKDSTGAALPGVTVETASPVLIERVRTATTDGTGQYQIVDLRPGTYSVTFRLAWVRHDQARRRGGVGSGRDRGWRRSTRRRYDGGAHAALPIVLP